MGTRMVNLDPLADAIRGFKNYPPDTLFQCGYLAALLETWRNLTGAQWPDAEIVEMVKKARLT